MATCLLGPPGGLSGDRASGSGDEGRSDWRRQRFSVASGTMGAVKAARPLVRGTRRRTARRLQLVGHCTDASHR
eukprot:scaffold1124_cov361-Prasinococcus_capsulatus_cf.AAC.9